MRRRDEDERVFPEYVVTAGLTVDGSVVFRFEQMVKADLGRKSPRSVASMGESLATRIIALYKSTRVPNFLNGSPF